MSWKKIVLLVAVLMILLVAVFLVNQKEAEKEAKAGKLMDFSGDKIVRMELQRGDEKFLFQKKENTWSLEHPLQAKADKVAVENIVDDFSSLKYDKMVDEQAADFKEFGLDAPRIRLALFEEKAEKPSYTILVGIKNEMDQSSYVKLAAGNKVVLVPSYRINYLEKALFDFREKKFMGFESTDVKAFSYTREGVSFRFQKKDDQWMMEKPVFSVAEDSKVSDMVYKATSLEAKSFKGAPDSQSLKDYALDEPLLDAEFQLSEGKRSLKIGKKEETYYAYNPDFGEICEIGTDVLDKFIKETNDLRSRKAAVFYSYDVKEFRFKSGDLDLEVRKNKENAWEWKDPKGMGVLDDEKVNSLLSALEGIQADSFVDTPGSMVVFPYSITLKVEAYGASSPKTIEMQISDLQEDSVLVRNPAYPYHLKVPKDILDKMPKKKEDLQKTEQ